MAIVRPTIRKAWLTAVESSLVFQTQWISYDRVSRQGCSMMLSQLMGKLPSIHDIHKVYFSLYVASVLILEYMYYPV